MSKHPKQDLAMQAEAWEACSNDWKQAHDALKAKADRLAEALERVKSGIELREYKACRHVIGAALADYRSTEGEK